jgi:apolipoprotein N-acyltransferase
VPVVRAANTGISGFIDSRGRVLNKSDVFVEAALTEEISIGNKQSFYTKYGDIFVFICIAATAFMLVNSFVLNRKK